MKSPFPGMDPYLDRRWGDVHSGLISAIKAALQPGLPGALRARGEQDIRVQDETDSEATLLFEGDIAVVEGDPLSATEGLSRHGGVAAVAEPLRIKVFPVVERHKWVQIIDTSDGNRVVTVIEILSPGNKSSSKLNQRYRKKLKEYARAGVNIVEIDLLRSRRSRLTIQSKDIPPARRAEYYTCINRASEPDEWLVYPMPLRQPLPAVPIPCRDSDADVILQLQPVIDRVYLEGGHDDIDYSKPPEPPFVPEDAAWAVECVKAARP